jgi:hypothetical protein
MRSVRPLSLPTNQTLSPHFSPIGIDFDLVLDQRTHPSIQRPLVLSMRFSRLALAAALGAVTTSGTTCAFQQNPKGQRSVAAAAAGLGSTQFALSFDGEDNQRRGGSNLPSLVWGQRRRASPLLFSTAAPAETTEAASEAKETYEFTVRSVGPAPRTADSQGSFSPYPTPSHRSRDVCSFVVVCRATWDGSWI